MIFRPYRIVANKIHKLYWKFSKLIAVPPVIVKSVNPKKPINTPMIFFNRILSLKNAMAITTTQRGVNELSIPARLLSMFFAIAAANKYAGSRLPQIADKITSGIFFTGILEK